MAYQSLYRRYRPQRFSEVRGQDHSSARCATPCARTASGTPTCSAVPAARARRRRRAILAKVLNCENPIDGEPDGNASRASPSSTARSFDVHEIDAASNNKVEDIRDLIEQGGARHAGRTKVYILDEVHMLTAAASNALLKTLEEPPEHVVFVLATTDPQKVLPTIRSRCQHFELHLLPADELAALASLHHRGRRRSTSPPGHGRLRRAGRAAARRATWSPPSTRSRPPAACPRAPRRSTSWSKRSAIATPARHCWPSIVRSRAGAGRRVLGELLIGRLRDVFLASVGDDLSRLADGDRDRVKAHRHATGRGRRHTRALEVLGEAFVGIQTRPIRGSRSRSRWCVSRDRTPS